MVTQRRLAQQRSGGERRRRKKVLHRGELQPFIAGGGCWKRAAQVAARSGGCGETRGTTLQKQPRSEHGWHGRRRYSDSVVDERGPHGFLFSSNYPNRFKHEN
jgi:hypothetical protein